MPSDDDPFAAFNTKRSNWTPRFNPPAVAAFINRCKQDIGRINLPAHHKTSNISKIEQTALRNLKHREDIIIKRADKGGATVVWRKDLYIAEAMRQLSDTNFYRKEDSDHTDKYNGLIKTTINAEIQQGHLPSSAKHLILVDPRCSRFYLLPKIHNDNIPGRPVVSACSCPSQNIATYLSTILRPVVEGLPSFVKDTTDALNVFGNFTFNEGIPVLFTMDVRSLYTSIPNNEGLTALFLNVELYRIHPRTHSFVWLNWYLRSTISNSTATSTLRKLEWLWDQRWVVTMLVSTWDIKNTCSVQATMDPYPNFTSVISTTALVLLPCPKLTLNTIY